MNGKISALLNSQQGEYLWGTRDCLMTCKVIMEGYLGEGQGLDYTRWHSIPEEYAIAIAKKEFGGSGGYHHFMFEDHDGVDVLPGHDSLERGDVVSLDGTIESLGAVWDTKKKGDLIGFVGDSHEVFNWTQFGLAPIEGEFTIKSIFRCLTS